MTDSDLLPANPRDWPLDPREDWDEYAARWECDGLTREEAERRAETMVRRERGIVFPATKVG